MKNVAKMMVKSKTEVELHDCRPVGPSPSESVQSSPILASHRRLLKGLGHNNLCAGKVVQFRNGASLFGF